MPTMYEVGKDFPGPVPTQQGGTMDIWPDGLVLYIQFPGLKGEEERAFKKSFTSYWYLEPKTPVPIAYWIFGFGRPMNAVECNFNARLCRQTIITNYLNVEDGVKNLLTIYLLDGHILKGIKAVGLKDDAVTSFHATIRKQLETPYSSEEYTRYLRSMEQFSVEELQLIATHFQK